MSAARSSTTKARVAVAKEIIPSSSVTTRTSAPRKTTQPCSEDFAELDGLKSLVIAENACALPGVSVRFGEFVSYMWFAVSKGFVRRDHAEFVQEGLQNGFDAGVNISSLRGRRVFKNYKSAVDHRSNDQIHCRQLSALSARQLTVLTVPDHDSCYCRPTADAL